MQLGLAFDVYGTLVDPLRMADYLVEVAGDEAERFAQVWREKQLEYSWRHSLMGHYVPFDECAREGLRYAARSFTLTLSAEAEATLLARLAHLESYPDAIPGIDALRAQGHR